MAAPELSPDEWKALADWIKAEKERRASHRLEREELWKEVDRQLAMKPRPRDKGPSAPAWYPDLELPLQYNALEVIQADVRRLMFPRAGSWFKCSAEISDVYRARWDAQRLQRPLIAGTGEPLEMNLDQETADIIAKQTLEHFHNLFSFKQAIGLFTTEQIKYGTGVCRVREVTAPRMAHEYRGESNAIVKGPAVIPCTIWHTYLDDTWSSLLHEGQMLGPSVIRRIGSQPLEDLRRAIEKGGAEEGYRKIDVKTFVPKTGEDERKHSVELYELEGDVIVPQNERDIYLPNVLVTIAIGQGTLDVIRFKENPMPFRSYVVGHYFQTDVRHAYGASPLIKGQPLQVMATEAANDYMAVSRLRALPPVSYDREDATFTAQGGPQVYPGAVWSTNSTVPVTAHEIGAPADLLNGFFGMVKQYEDTTGNNDARRGQRMKSHTTEGAAQIEAGQGMSRTDDFVTDTLAGPLKTILHMEYEIARKSLRKPQAVYIGAEGIDGWIDVSSQDLADRCEFEPIGAEGVLEERQTAEKFLLWGKSLIEMATVAAQMGIPLQVDFQALAREGGERLGITNTSKFIGPVAAVTAGASAESIIPGVAQGTPIMPGGPEAPEMGTEPGPTLQ